MKLSREDLTEVMEELGEVLESAGDYLDMGDKAVESLRPILSKALRILLEAWNDTYSELEPELEVSALLKAKALRRDYTSYVRAGFSKNQAFTLVLASVKPVNFTEIMRGVASATKSTPDKN